MWSRVAIALAFRRANRTHTFRDVTLRPDMLPVISGFIGSATILDDIECAACESQHLHSSNNCEPIDGFAALKQQVAASVRLASFKLSSFVVCRYALAVVAAPTLPLRRNERSLKRKAL